MKNELKKLNIVRKRRAKRCRAKISGIKEIPRLSISISNMFIYLQLIDDVSRTTITSSHSRNVNGGKVLSNIKSTKKANAHKGNIKTISSKRINKKSIKIAEIVGKDIAEKAKVAGIKRIVLDSGRHRFHGVVKTIADTIKSNGISI